MTKVENDLFERLRTTLLWNGPQKTSELQDKFPEYTRKQILTILEQNHYTFDFNLREGSKTWRVIE